jgi:DNA polymerase I-like protein with 3'-5' exonuclease and polymerase domains
MKILETDLTSTELALEEYIPELPDGLEFNWASNVHKSAIVFGGTIKYKKKAPYKDPNTGELARKLETQDWPLFDGVPVDPATEPDLDDADKFTSGKNKGAVKYKKVKVPGEIKEKIQEFTVELPGYTVPNPAWQGKATDGAGEPIYSVNDDVITELGSRDIPFLKLMSARQNLTKDLGTYYVRYDPKRRDYVGMLTCVMKGTHIIHHLLNHTSTVTSRLSSSNPNLQNIPRGDTSEVKKMFISRFEGGMMMEVDYSQLEVVVQGLLSGDKNLCQDLRNKIDFHCKRVSAKFGCTYEEALHRCKDATFAEHALWKTRRTKCKEFSFQRAYGAGAAAIAASTGMSIDDVKDLIEAEDIMYPGVTEFNSNVEKTVKRSAKAFKDPMRGFRTFRRGFWQSPTGTMYTFRSYDAPSFLKEKGIDDSFMPTEMKNYPVQGTGGEIVQIILGKLVRHFIKMKNYGGKALLCNTVHDCVWIDYHPDVQEQLAADVKRIMESVPEVLEELYGMDVQVPFPIEIEIGPNLYDKTVLHI